MHDKRLIYQRYMDGEKVASMAKELGLSKERIYQFIRTYGVVCKNGFYYGSHKPLDGAERFVFNKLVKHRVKMKDYTSIWHDLETKKGKRIEVKHRRNAAKDGYYRANVFNKDFVDFVVFVVGEVKDERVYIIPSEECPRSLIIAKNPINITKRSKEKYLNKWETIS